MVLKVEQTFKVSWLDKTFESKTQKKERELRKMHKS
jgi:hypothetical protein